MKITATRPIKALTSKGLALKLVMSKTAAKGKAAMMSSSRVGGADFLWGRDRVMG